MTLKLHLIESDQDMEGAKLGKNDSSSSLRRIILASPDGFSSALLQDVLLKLLRFDMKTHAMIFPYTMAPGFRQDNISYHDYTEE